MRIIRLPPRALYTFMGFSENGEMDGEEIVSVLQL